VDEPLLNRYDLFCSAFAGASGGFGTVARGAATCAARATAFNIRGVAPQRQILGRLDN
jgi:hypothetical protein